MTADADPYWWQNASPCQLYGHLFEDDEDRPGWRRCTDCDEDSEPDVPATT